MKICQAELQSLPAGKTKTNHQQLDTCTAGSTHDLRQNPQVSIAIMRKLMLVKLAQVKTGSDRENNILSFPLDSTLVQKSL